MEKAYRNNERMFMNQVLENLRFRWWLYLLIVLAFEMLAWVLATYVVPPTYQADATMLVNVREESTASITTEQISSAEELANLYGVIVKSDTVLDVVIQMLNLDMDYEHLVKKVSVSSVDNTSIIKISVNDENPKKALKILQQIVAVAPEIIRNTVEAGSVKVVSEPRVQVEPVSPDRLQYMIIGALVAFLLALAWILIVVAREDKVKDRKDIEERLGLTVVGEIPEIVSKRNDSSRNRRFKSVLSEDLPFSYREAFRYLYMTVSQKMEKQKKKTILVTSAVAGEGKSSVAINLALSLKANSAKVLLIECDMRKPVFRDYLNMGFATKKGLADILKGQSGAKDLILHKDGIFILPAGTQDANPAELLGSERMKAMIGVMERCFDYIILDTPPSLEIADAKAICPFIHGVLFVIRYDYAEIRDIDNSIQKILSTGTEMYGAVLNGYREMTHKNKHGYGYSYGYQ